MLQLNQLMNVIFRQRTLVIGLGRSAELLLVIGLGRSAGRSRISVWHRPVGGVSPRSSFSSRSALVGLMTPSTSKPAKLLTSLWMRLSCGGACTGGRGAERWRGRALAPDALCRSQEYLEVLEPAQTHHWSITFIDNTKHEPAEIRTETIDPIIQIVVN